MTTTDKPITTRASYVQARLLGLRPDRPLPLPNMCDHCYFWKPHSLDQPTTGDCRKHAPECPPQQAFPSTDAYDLCGEFKRNYTTEEWMAIRHALWPDKYLTDGKSK